MVSVWICLTHTQDNSAHGCLTTHFCKLYQSVPLLKVFYAYVTTTCDNYKRNMLFSNEWEQNQTWKHLDLTNFCTVLQDPAYVLDGIRTFIFMTLNHFLPVWKISGNCLLINRLTQGRSARAQSFQWIIINANTQQVRKYSV